MNPARKPLILLVDDTPANLGVLFELLKGYGFKVSVAEDGESALEQVNYARPDLILLDVLMPLIDGFTTCERLKAQPETREIPVIFMTALTDTVDKVKGFELGAVDYITKPFQQEEVLARIRTHLSLQQLKASLKESEERLSHIIESAMDAIITLDQDGRILLFNRAAERVFRCSAGKAMGGPCKRFLSEELCQVLNGYVRGQPPGLKGPMWVPAGHKAVRADGSPFPIEATLSYAEASGQALHTIILRDIQERQRAEIERRQLQGLTCYLEEELRLAQGAEAVIGAAQGLRPIMEQLEPVAGTDATVLITGETGTGKEVIARAIHSRSKRKDRIMVKLNCAAIPKDLVESELFGHEKGAFTGAFTRKLGRFELADQGTLFLDEVGDLPLDLQAKLLRVLQEGEFERVGGTQTIKVDVRLIAATNRDLVQCMKDGSFRTDLYYRLHVFPIALPPLRDRKEDLPLLLQHFVHKYSEKYGKRIATIPVSAMTAWRAYAWPGNVRELEHRIERAVILSQGTELAVDQGLPQTPKETPALTRTETLEEAERAHILKVLEATGWRVAGKGGAAEVLGLKRGTLESRMKKLGIRRPV
jgi:PAS domain S-box-containing protein